MFCSRGGGLENCCPSLKFVAEILGVNCLCLGSLFGLSKDGGGAGDEGGKGGGGAMYGSFRPSMSSALSSILMVGLLLDFFSGVMFEKEERRFEMTSVEAGFTGISLGLLFRRWRDCDFRRRLEAIEAMWSGVIRRGRSIEALDIVKAT